MTNTYEQHIRDTVYGTLLHLNFLNESEFSIQEIRDIFGINNTKQLNEDAQSDIDTEVYAQGIITDLMKEFNKRIREFLTNNKPFNPIFEIEGIKFGFQQFDQERFSSLPENQEVFILCDLLHLWTFQNIKYIKHEIIHCLDARRVKDKNAIKSTLDKKGMEYYTAPFEYNALSHEFFQEILENIIEDCEKQGINPRDYFSNKRALANFISATMTAVCENLNDEYHTFLASLPENMQRRIFNRAYAILEKELFESIKDITVACNESNSKIFMENLIESILSKGEK